MVLKSPVPSCATTTWTMGETVSRQKIVGISMVFSFCRSRSSCGEAALAQHIKGHGENDNGADHDLLPVGIDPQQIASIGEQADDEGSHQSACDAAFASLQAASSDHNGRDRLQFVALAGSGLACHQTRGLYHAS